MGASVQRAVASPGRQPGKRVGKRQGKKGRIRIRGRFFALLGILLIIAAFFYVWQDQYSREAPHVSQIAGIPVTHHFIEKGTPGRPGTERKIQFVIIHETGNQGAGANAKSHDSYIHEAALADPISWHYTVDDHEIYHHLPDNEIGYNAGDGATGGDGNTHGIGVELCVNQDGDYEKTLQNGAVLTAWLLKSYGLDLDDVKKHQDFSGKKCPERLIESGRWEKFLHLVEEKRKEV